jgi:signal transduction histidine kinase
MNRYQDAAAGTLHPARWRWVRRPRRSVRLKLTLLYAGLFLVSGAGLLLITYVLVAHRLPVLETVRGPSQSTGQPTSLGTGFMFSGGKSSCPPVTAAPRVPAGQAQAQIGRCLAVQKVTELNQLLIESGIALAIMTVAAAGLGWLMAGRVLRPLRTITAAARSVSATSLHARLGLPGPDDELKELGDTFDALLARLEAAFAAQRQFVANASHELRTPLARQRTLIEVGLAGPEPTAAALRQVCERVLAAGEQQETLIEALLTLARSQRGLDSREPVDLAAIAHEVVQARRAEAGLRGLTTAAGLGPAPALGDARLADRLVANLVDNALRHNVPGGAVEVSTGMWQSRAVLSVSNTGPVIPHAEVGRLFQPFQRRSADRTGSDGLGLGLSIVSAIAEAHGAWLQAHALPRGGLLVQVGFPGAPHFTAPPGTPQHLGTQFRDAGQQPVHV